MDITKYFDGGKSPSAPAFSWSVPDFSTGFSTTPMANAGKVGKSSHVVTAMYIFFIIAIFVAIGYALSLVVHIPGISPSASLPRTSAPFWTGPEVYTQEANMNLQADISAAVRPSDSAKYAVSFEMKIQAPFTNTSALRHVFHRGGSIVKIDPNGTRHPVAEENIQTALNLQVPGPSTAGIVINPGVFIAAGSTNTLWVLIQDSNNTLIASALIPNVPVYKPFRLTISVSDHVMDVYVDCHLAKTLYLKGTVPAATLTKIFGHLGTDFPGIIGAVRYYPVPLTAQQISKLCDIGMTVRL